VPNLALDVDPKLAWALRHREAFPVDVNRASRRELLRVPGFGAIAVERILRMRRWRRLRTEDLLRLRVPVARALPFVVAADRNPASRLLDLPDLRTRLVPRRAQLELFPAAG
jgi:predicted DNA-binding helix-hairpin-helix protein